MAKKSIAEDTQSQFNNNVTSKVNKGDGPQKIPGEIETVNKKAHIDAEQDHPDYSAATSKDTSKSGEVAKKVGAGEQKGTLNTMPMVQKLKGDAKIVNEDEETDADVELTEEEIEAYNEHRAAVMESLAAKLDAYLPGDEALDVSEHVNVLFDGQDLSEEFKGKATNIFEAAVRAEALNVAAAILEAATDLVIENDLKLTEEYDAKIEGAVGAIAESWAEANVVPLQARLKTEITEDFIHGLIKLLGEHNIMLPDEKVDVVEAMADKITELEAEINEQMKTIIDQRAALEESYREDVVEKLTEGLTDVQAQKLRTLCEGIRSSEDFEAAASQLKESYFGAKSKAKLGTGTSGEENVLTESEVNAEAKMVNEEASKPKAVEPAAAVLDRFAPRRK